MTAYADIVEWVASRPWWQQRVLARLASGASLGSAELEALADALMGPEPIPPRGGWLADLQPPAGTSSPPVVLRAIRDVSNVNRLAEGETLTFEPTGLTVVYGNNGSGKSGYARLVKSLVHTRDKESILPNIFSAVSGPQSARLEYEWGGEQRSVLLSDAAPPELQQVAFYDERCGELYVRKEGEAIYRPSAVALLDGLVEVCDRIRSVLDGRLAANGRRTKAMPDLDGGTEAGKFLRGLNGDTKDEALALICSVPEDVGGQIEAAREEEQRLRATTPAKEAARLKRLAEAFNTISTHLDGLAVDLGIEAGMALEVLRGNARDSRRLADEAAAAGFDELPLAGVGSPAWRALWSAAQKFSEAAAYPGHSFPDTGASSRCVLCQQPLDSDARSRLARFHKMMLDTTEAEARAAASRLDIRVRAVERILIDTAALAVALDHIQESDPAVHQEVVATLTIWRCRQAGMLADSTTPSAPGPELPRLLKAKGGAAATTAGTIDATAFDLNIRQLVDRQRELSAKAALASVQVRLRNERDRRREHELLTEARRQTDTRAISRKLGDVTAKHVTVVVQDRFSRESQDLRVEAVTLLQKNVLHGTVLHKPEFVGAAVQADLPAVLSEGEQTALGLAGFFVEAHLVGSQSAIVLDDPVTSLDHLRRERVALRLVRFAEERQVVVFTHDAVFAGELLRIATEEGVAYAARSIERRGIAGQPGFCRGEHPWKAKDARSRLGSLKQDLVRLRKESANWDIDTWEGEIGSWAGRLSETWERFVSQDLAGALFDRGSEEVRPTMLKLLERFTAQDNKEFQDSYKRVSRWATRHDKSASLNYVPPTIDDLEAELDRAYSWHERVRRYKE